MHSKGKQSKIIPNTRCQISVKICGSGIRYQLKFHGSDIRYQLKFHGSDIGYQLRFCGSKNLDDLNLKQQRQIKEREERTLAKGSMLMSNSDLG